MVVKADSPARTGLFGVPREVGTLPHVWLIFMGFFLFGMTAYRIGDWQLWANLAGLALFLPAYYSAFRCTGSQLYRPIVIIVLLGAVLSPINEGANVLLQYAAFFAGMAAPPRRAALIVAGICGVIVLNTVLFNLPPWYTIPGLVVAVGLFGVAVNVRQQEIANAELRRSQDEVERLAQLAERERIARDLHDVVGHTLSMITLKAELARKLVHDRPEQCERELREIEAASRDALAEVRDTVAGYHSVGLPDELEAARSALKLANVTLAAQLDDVSLPARQETLLAMLLREAVTNVVRHANARHVTIALEKLRDEVVLTVEDDGDGFAGREGQGLTGMRERLALIGGRLRIGADRGTQVEARMPLAEPFA